jgi:pyruvate-formate lyase
MSLWVNTQACTAIRNQRRRTGLHSFLAVLINNNMNVGFGQKTAASAEGRRRGDSLSNGNQPGVGADVAGPTALLNSMAKLDPGLHAGAVQNLKLSRSMFGAHRQALEALLAGYFDSGGTQLMLTVTDRGELERAMQFPSSIPICSCASVGTANALSTCRAPSSWKSSRECCTNENRDCF